MMRRFKAFAFAVACFASAVAHAQQGDDYVRYLVPVSLAQVRGASGANWSSTLVLANDTGRTLQYNEDVLPGPRCGPGPCVTTMGVDRSEIVSHPLASASTPALLMYVRRDVAPDVRFSLRLRDLNRADSSSGQQIPVVAEEDFRTGASNLLIVQPTNERHRTLLRVYDPDAREGAVVRVRVYAAFASGIEPLIADRVLVLQRPVQPAEGLPYYPGYAEVPVDAAFLGRSDLSPTISLRLKVEPLTPGLRYWAMASMTSNNTNEVTIVTPDL